MESLSEWLQQLGCPVEFSQKELQKLNSLKMKPIWRHLKTCVKPTFHAQTVRKNLLLDKLNSSDNSTQSTNFGSFRIESVRELTLVEEINNTQEQIDNLNDKTKVVDHQLYSSSSTLVMKNLEKKLYKDRLKEVEDKSGLLDFMVDSIKENITNIDKNMDYLAFCQLSPVPGSYLEMKQNQATFMNYVLQLSSMETEDEDFINEIVMKSLQLSPMLILNSLLASSNTSLKSLHSKLNQKFWSHEQSSSKLINESLSNLNAEVLRNEIDLFNSSREVSKLSIGFENSKEVLAKTIEESFNQRTEDKEEVDFSAMVGSVNEFLQHIRVNRKNCKIRLLLEEQFTKTMDTDYLKSTVNNNGEERDRMQTLVDERVNGINRLLQNIFDRKESIKLFLSRTSKTNTELATSFFIEYNLSKTDGNPYHFASFKNVIKEELELFQRIPLAALTRKWEDLSSILSEKLDEDFTKNSVLCSVLFHSELKNVTLSLLERLYWLHSFD